MCVWVQSWFVRIRVETSGVGSTTQACLCLSLPAIQCTVTVSSLIAHSCPVRKVQTACGCGGSAHHKADVSCKCVALQICPFHPVPFVCDFQGLTVQVFSSWSSPQFCSNDLVEKELGTKALEFNTRSCR